MSQRRSRLLQLLLVQQLGLVVLTAEVQAAQAQHGAHDTEHAQALLAAHTHLLQRVPQLRKVGSVVEVRKGVGLQARARERESRVG